MPAQAPQPARPLRTCQRCGRAKGRRHFFPKRAMERNMSPADYGLTKDCYACRLPTWKTPLRGRWRPDDPDERAIQEAMQNLQLDIVEQQEDGIDGNDGDHRDSDAGDIVLRVNIAGVGRGGADIVGQRVQDADAGREPQQRPPQSPRPPPPALPQQPPPPQQQQQQLRQELENPQQRRQGQDQANPVQQQQQTDQASIFGGPWRAIDYGPAVFVFGTGMYALFSIQDYLS